MAKNIIIIYVNILGRSDDHPAVLIPQYTVEGQKS